MLMLNARRRVLQHVAGSRAVATSAPKLGGSPPFYHQPPAPPPEFEPDGTPKKYPLHQPIWDHGYDWEHWALQPAGIFHTVYIGDFAQDYPPYWAWLQKWPMWIMAPILSLWSIIFMIIFQNSGSIGIKPKRYTIEWMQATRERERQENTNPVTRYLDRRRNERGGMWLAQYSLPWHPYWVWMSNAHDPDFPEFYQPHTISPHLHYSDDMSKSYVNQDE